MFGRSFTLFRLFGFTVRIDASWVIVAVLIMSSMAALFGREHPEIGTGTVWAMALVGLLGLFASIVLHELSHSAVARLLGIHIRGITLFIFGGMAEMAADVRSAAAEFWMAIVGPLTSFALAALFFLAVRTGRTAGWPAPPIEVLSYMAFVNVTLGSFNLLRGFPLDGGRIVRAMLWRWRHDLRWATRIATSMGASLGLVLIGFGVAIALGGDVLGGVWSALIGLFLRRAAQNSYAQMRLCNTARVGPHDREPMAVRLLPPEWR